MAHFARGARGAPITPLRVALKLGPSNPVPHDPGFDEFDGPLQQAVILFQQQEHLTATGIVDAELYKKITGTDWPDLFHRAVMVVGMIEDHGYGTKFAPHKADKAGLTGGIIGFTAKSGSLNVVLAAIDATVIDAAFTAHGITTQEQSSYLAFVALGNSSADVSKRTKAAVSLFHVSGGTAIAKKWEAFLRQVLLSDSGRAAQDLVALRDYFANGEKAALANGLTSDYGRLLTFSINVQSFLTSKLVSSGTDRERRIAIALTRASTIGGKFKANFEARHLQLARGLGFPNGRFLDLTACGFDNPDPLPTTRSSILSLPLSSKPAMVAVTRFEVEATRVIPPSQPVVNDRVWALPDVQARLVAAKVPFANANHADKTPDLSHAWRDDLGTGSHATVRRAYLELLIALDERPIDCLVLASPTLGRGRDFWLWSTQGPLKIHCTPGLIQWTGARLQLPLTLQMRHGLVILYAPNAITPSLKQTFAKRLSAAIAVVTGTPPVMLGWHGHVTLPGTQGPTPAAAFFNHIRQLMTDSGAANLSELVASKPIDVIQAWGHACNDTFAANPDKTFLPLWRKSKLDKKTKKEVVLSACAAFGDDEGVWLASAKPQGGVFMERQP